MSLFVAAVAMVSFGLMVIAGLVAILGDDIKWFKTMGASAIVCLACLMIMMVIHVLESGFIP